MYEFDIKTLIRVVLAKRKRIFINCGISIVLALVVGYSIPKQYVSSVKLASEMNESNGMGGMNDLASIAGINLGNRTDAIVPELYPDVVVTNDFLVELLKVKVQTQDGRVDDTFLNYLTEHCDAPWWAKGRVAAVRAVKGLFQRDDVTKKGEAQFNPQHLNETQYAIIKSMQGMVSCAVDKNTGIISISVRTQDPLVSKMMVDTVTAHLQDFIRTYRTSKVRGDLEYYRQIEEEAKQKYQESQRAYADYCDTHRDAILQSSIMVQERLENELQLAFNNYSQIKQQVQMAEAKVQESTPAFTVIEKASVPIRHESPKKLFLIISYLFVAFFGTLTWIYCRLLFSKSYKETFSPSDGQSSAVSFSKDEGNDGAESEKRASSPM